MKKLFVLFIAITAFAMGFAQKVDPRYIDGIIYMKLVDDYPLNFRVDIDHGREVSPNAFPFLKPVFEKYGVKFIAQTLYLFDDPKLLHTLAINFDDIYRVDEFIAELEKFAQVEYAEKPTLKHLCDYTPNDPLYTQSYYGYNFNWYLNKIFASAAWELQLGDPSVKVAVVDNAIYGNHEDLGIASSNLCTVTTGNDGFTINYNTGSADPPTSVSTSCSGYNYYNCPGYDWSHGTHCAGLVGAKTNNGVGIASIGGGVTLMGVRVTNSGGEIVYDMNGVQWAANNGANVISMSYGAAQSYQTEQQLMQTCYNNGIILVAAAGNEGDQTNHISYPGGYSTVISVASVSGNGKLSYFSQYGSGRADIAAPGGFSGGEGSYSNPQPSGLNILSTTYNQCAMWTDSYGINTMSGKRYDGMQGTSMATPIVAGLCGLLKSACPNLTPAQAKTALQSTAQALASDSHTIDGNGYINAYSAVLYVQNLSSCGGGGSSCGTPTGLSANAGTSSITLSWSAVSGATSYKIFRNGTQIGTSTTTSYTDNTAAAGTTYSYTVKAVCSSGESSSSSSVSATISGGGGGSTSCKYMNYPLSGTATYYGCEDGGYACGSNAYGDAAKANFISYSGSGTVSKMKLQFAAFDEGVSGSLIFKIWASNNGTPGNALGSKTVTFTEIANSINTQTGEYEVTFSPAISVSGNFFAGIDMTQSSGYFSLVSNTNGETNPGIAWELYNGSWSAMSGQGSWGLNIALAIFPYVCGTGVGIEDETSVGEFAIFPNPATDLLYVVLPEGTQNQNLTIFDLSGKAIMSQMLNDTNTTINVGNLSSGIYFVKVGNNTKKFVKE
ncbi:MAG: S8 family serine peptidase [Bacteroidales bacterium]|nr:S8 family serine peptidase [Bacteroidales bacterium]